VGTKSGPVYVSLMIAFHRDGPGEGGGLLGPLRVDKTLGHPGPDRKRRVVKGDGEVQKKAAA